MKVNVDKLAEFAGYVPNKWQKEVQKSDARFKIICAGRRSGKSFYVTHDPIDGVLPALITPRQHVWIVAPNYDLAQRVWIPIVQLARNKFSYNIRRIWDTKGAYRMDTWQGTTIEAKSAEEPQKLVGVQLTKLIVDEAALVKPKSWFESLRPTLVGTKETQVGKAIFIGTPKGKNWYYDLWLKGQPPKDEEWESWRYTSYDNDHLDRVELDKLTKDMPDYEYRQEILAEFSETAEQIFRNIRNNIKTNVKESGRYCLGADLGRKSAYSVIFVIDKVSRHVVYFDRFRKVSWAIQIGRFQKAIEKYKPYPIVVDATGIGDPVIEDLEKEIGRKVQSFMFGEVSKKQLIDKAAIYVEQGKVSYPDIPILFKEMERFGRFISKETGNYKYRAMGAFTTDCVMGFSLAIWPLREYSDEPSNPILFKHQEY